MNNKLIINIISSSRITSILLLLIIACFFCCCSNNTVIAPKNANPPTFAGWINLKVSPQWIGTNDKSITITYTSKVTENTPVTGILYIKDINGCEAKRYESIVLNNENSLVTYDITPNQFNSNCNSVNKVYEVYISYTANNITKESQHITFVYGSPSLSNCLNGTPNDITFEYDYMNLVQPLPLPTILYDFLYTPRAPFAGTNVYLQQFNTAFNTTNGCNTNIIFDRFSTRNGNYAELRCESLDYDALILVLKNYCIGNRDNSGQYMVSADKLRNAPTINNVDYNTVLGVTPNISTSFPNYRPCFVFYGNINGYGDLDKQLFSMGSAAHEIGHSRNINENEEHSLNQSCCVMKNSISGCYTINNPNFYFCEYHRCQMYNNNTNTTVSSKINKTNINHINF